MKTVFWIFGPSLILYVLLSKLDDYIFGEQLTENQRTARHIACLVISISLVFLVALRETGIYPGRLDNLDVNLRGVAWGIAAFVVGMVALRAGIFYYLRKNSQNPPEKAQPSSVASTFRPYIPPAKVAASIIPIADFKLKDKPRNTRFISLISLTLVLAVIGANISAYAVSGGMPGWSKSLLGILFSAISYFWIPLSFLASIYSFRFWNIENDSNPVVVVLIQGVNIFNMVAFSLWLLFLGLIFAAAGLR